MKKQMISIGLVLAVLISFAACSGGDGGLSAKDLGVTDKKIEMFADHVLKDQYAEAIDFYNKEISGNSQLETEAASCLQQYLTEIEANAFAGKYDDTQARTKENTVEKVYLSTNCKPDRYEELKAGIQDAFASKVAYKSGVSLLEAGNYADAIAEFSKVSPRDSDYTTALEKKAQATETFKSQILKKAKDYQSGQDFVKAIEILKNGASVLPEDVDIRAEITTCEKTHIQSIVAEAESVFTEYTKYEDALKLIQSGLQYYSDSQTLLDKREYYQSYVPMNLYDMDAVKGEAATYEVDKDTYNNEHKKSFYVGYGEWSIWSGETNITFDLKGQYNRFTATVYGRSTKNESDTYGVILYGDGKVLYENTDIRDNERPFQIEADVTGVSDLTVVMRRVEGGVITRGIGLTDMILQKTRL